MAKKTPRRRHQFDKQMAPVGSTHVAPVWHTHSIIIHSYSLHQKGTSLTHTWPQLLSYTWHQCDTHRASSYIATAYIKKAPVWHTHGPSWFHTHGAPVWHTQSIIIHGHSLHQKGTSLTHTHGPSWFHTHVAPVWHTENIIIHGHSLHQKGTSLKHTHGPSWFHTRGTSVTHREHHHTWPQLRSVCWPTTSLRQWLAASSLPDWTTATLYCLMRFLQHLTYCNKRRTSWSESSASVNVEQMSVHSSGRFTGNGSATRCTHHHTCIVCLCGVYVESDVKHVLHLSRLNKTHQRYSNEIAWTHPWWGFYNVQHPYVCDVQMNVFAHRRCGLQNILATVHVSSRWWEQVRGAGCISSITQETSKRVGLRQSGARRC